MKKILFFSFIFLFGLPVFSVVKKTELLGQMFAGAIKLGSKGIADAIIFSDKGGGTLSNFDWAEDDYNDKFDSKVPVKATEAKGIELKDLDPEPGTKGEKAVALFAKIAGSRKSNFGYLVASGLKTSEPAKATELQKAVEAAVA